MDCSGYNQNAHYHNRNGRNMVNGSMNFGRNNCGNMMQSRSSCGNMAQNRNVCSNRKSTCNAYGNMSSNKNSDCNMNRLGNNCRDKECDNNDYDSNKQCNCINEDRTDEGCDRGKEPVDSMMPAMSYVPWQQWEDIYCMEEALEKGTIFAQLDKPYVGRMAK